MSDPAEASWQLRDLLKRWQDLARSGWEHDRPDPDPWAILAADMLAFRAALEADGGPLFRVAEALESIVSLRLALEHDPAFQRTRPRWLPRLRRAPRLRESRRLHDHLGRIRIELLLAAVPQEVS